MLVRSLSYADILLMAPYIFLLFPSGTIMSMRVALELKLAPDVLSKYVLGVTNIFRLLLVVIAVSMFFAWANWWTVLTAAIGVVLVVRSHFQDTAALQKTYSNIPELSEAIRKCVGSINVLYFLVCLLGLFSVIANVYVGITALFIAVFYLFLASGYQRVTKDSLPVGTMAVISIVWAVGYYLYTHP